MANEIKVFSNQNLMDPPLLKIGETEVTLFKPFTINLIPGADPTTFTICLDDDSASKIWNESQAASAISGNNIAPLNISFKYNELGKSYEGELKNFYCIEKRFSSRYYTELVFTDIRYFGYHRMITGRYNFRRQTANAQLEISDQLPNPVFVDRFIFATDRYLDWSINSDKPWRVIEIIDQLMKRIFGGHFGGYIVDGTATKDVGAVNWTDVAPDNMVFEGKSLAATLNWLLLLSRTSMNIFPHVDGKIYCYRLEEEKTFDINSYIPGKDYITTDSSLIYLRDLRRFAPEWYYIWFPPLVEYPLVYDYASYDGLSSDALFKKFMDDFVFKTETIPVRNITIDPLVVGLNTKPKLATGSTAEPELSFVGEKIDQITGRNPDINLWNVAQAPYFIDINYDGRKIRFPKGSWIPIQILMKEINFPEEYLRKYWYDAAWIDIFITARGSGKLAIGPNEVNPVLGMPEDIKRYDKRLMAAVKSIHQSWWRTFMVHPTLRKGLGQIEFTRTEMENYEYNYRQTAPVWFPYIDAPTSAQMNSTKKLINPVQMSEDIPDLSVEDILKSAQAPFTIEIISQPLGIFQVLEQDDYSNMHYSFEPGIIPEDKLPKSTPEVDDNITWGGAHKDPKFRLMTIMTSSPVVPNNIAQRYLIKVPCSIGGSNGVKDIVTTYEYARFSWDDTLTETKKIDEAPRNVDDLKEVAKAEANMADYQFMQWYVGNMSFAGFHKINPRCNFVVSFTFNDHEVSTGLQANVPSPPQSIYPLIGSGTEGQNLRRKLAHELPLTTEGM